MQDSHHLLFSNPNKSWAIKEIDNLIEEWQQWYSYVQNLEDHADYDPNTCTEAIKDGWKNIRKHEVIREKTLVFLRNSFSGYEFLFENWPRHPHEDVTSRLRRKVPTWLHRLEILRASIGLQSMTGSESSDSLSDVHDMYGIHAVINEKCYELYKNKAYAEAVEKSFKVVKDKLRSLTGYESGSDAFGKGKLYITLQRRLFLTS